MVTTQALVAANVPRPGESTSYVGTADGFVDAFSANGYLRWQVDLGRLAHPCTQIPGGWGVTGTPVIDPVKRNLYVVDAFGRIHALDLATGAERRGWPVLLYHDFHDELVWGALLLVHGSIYAGTGSYCDQPMEGKIVRVDVATRAVIDVGSRSLPRRAAAAACGDGVARCTAPGGTRSSRSRRMPSRAVRTQARRSASRPGTASIWWSCRRLSR